MHFDIVLTFNITFNNDLNNVSSSYYTTFSAAVSVDLTAILNAAALQITDAALNSLVWIFTEGSTIATANSIPVLNVTDEAVAQSLLTEAVNSIPDLKSITITGNTPALYLKMYGSHQLYFN